METLTEERRPAPRVAESPPAQAARSKPLALLAAMRPREWIKNLLVFAGLLFSGKLDEGAQVVDATAAFAAFCAISSAGYLFNDLRDAVHDRQHPQKRLRPVASGELSVAAARVSAVVLAAIGIGVALVGVSAELAGIVALYGVITAAYSLILKQLVILDVMTIASLFLLRVVAGAVAVEASASEWLLLCTAMLALFLGFTKRRQEAMSVNAAPAAPASARELEGAPARAAEGPDTGAAGSRVTRPVLEHYSLAFLDQMVSMVTAAAIISYAIYAVNSPLIGSRMLATAPSVLYGIFRYLYLIYDRGDTRPTSAILTRDPGMIFAAVSWIAAALAMLYVFD
jgi:4-hydroxybenzoate polyprenyltransferase